MHRDSPQPRAPLAHLQEQGEIAPLSPRVSFSSPSSYKTCATSLHMNKEKRGMKIYYMRVQMKKGVAVSWEAEKPSESLEKQPRMEEVTLPEDVWVGTPPSDVSTRNLLSDSEPSGEEKEHEERVESDSPIPGSPAVEERPRARTPDWLVTMETGFRCMACCRVFPSLEVLPQTPGPSAIPQDLGRDLCPSAHAEPCVVGLPCRSLQRWAALLRPHPHLGASTH